VTCCASSAVQEGGCGLQLVPDSLPGSVLVLCKLPRRPPCSCIWRSLLTPALLLPAPPHACTAVWCTVAAVGCILSGSVTCATSLAHVLH